jgi:hypothetical protein
MDLHIGEMQELPPIDRIKLKNKVMEVQKVRVVGSFKTSKFDLFGLRISAIIVKTNKI